MADLEDELADGNGVAPDEPAIGLNGLAPGTPNIADCPASWSIQKASSRWGPSIGTPVRSAISATPPQWSTWPWVTSTLSSVAPLFATASSSRSTSPPGSTSAARFVRAQITKEQFCWNGVTGRTESFTDSDPGLRAAAHRRHAGAQVARTGGAAR